MSMILVGVAPRSWAVGVWHKPSKTIYAFGPLRLVLWSQLGPWSA